MKSTQEWFIIKVVLFFISIGFIALPAKSSPLIIKAPLNDTVYKKAGDKVAVLIAGYRGTGDYLWESTNAIGRHAYQRLRAMGYAKDEIYYYNPYLLQNIDQEDGFDEIRGYPHLTIFDPAIHSSPFAKINTEGAAELLIFLVGHGNKNRFCLNPYEILPADAFLKTIMHIAPHVKGHIIFIYDACQSGSFLEAIEQAIEQNPQDLLSQKLITIASTSPNKTAYFLKHGTVSFSYPFFDMWYLTSSIMTAFSHAQLSLQLTGQTPCISDPVLAESWDWKKNSYSDNIGYEIKEGTRDYNTINNDLSYSLNRANIQGEGHAIFTDCNVRTERKKGGSHYLLSLTPHPEAKEITAWVVLTSSPGPHQRSTIVDLLPPSYTARINSGDIYEKATFMAEGNTGRESDIRKTQWEEIRIVHTDNSIGEDPFEPDVPELILSDTDHEITVNALPVMRTFYSPQPPPNDSTSVPAEECQDVDWLFFHALKGHIYEIYAQDLSENGYSIQLALYDDTMILLHDPDTMDYCQADNYLVFKCPKSGIYLLKSELVSSYPAKGVEYILSVSNPQAGEPTDISGRIVDPNGKGIDGLKVQVRDENGNVHRHACTVSISGKSGGGYFCIHNIIMSLEYLTLEVCLPDPNGPDEILYTQTLPKLLPYSNTRIPDITISVIPPTPPEPFGEEMDHYRTDCKKYPEWTHCLPSGDCDCDLPLKGDYDGDGLTNLEEVCFYTTSSLMPTIIFPLSKGMNLLYIPSILDKSHLITKGYTSFNYNAYNIYYYDPIVTKWKVIANKFPFEPDHFNAIYCPEPALLCLDLIPGNKKPVLILEGILDIDFTFPRYRSKTYQALFDPNRFSPGVSTYEILKDPKYSSIQTISSQNPQDGRWESSYRLFGKPSGQDIRIQPYAIYVVTKKRGEDRLK